MSTRAAPTPAGLDALFGRVVLPLLSRWRRDPAARYVAHYERFFRCTREALRGRQLRDLRRMLVHAGDTSPFYRERFAKHGFDPRRAPLPEGLQSIPSLARIDIVERYEDMVSLAYDRTRLDTRKTGGTVNVPVPFYQDREAVARKGALTTVFRRAMGWHPGMKQAWVWGAAQDKPAQERGPVHALKEDAIVRHVERILDVDAGSFSPAEVDAKIEALRRFGPDVIQGYPVATDLIAQRMLERGVRFHVPLVVLTAEPVLETHRRRIGEAMGANVLSFYGSRENGWIAYDHPETKEMLINTAGVFLETHPETGEIYVTDLLNRGMPLIRYEIGDVGTLSDAPARCGAPHPVLASIGGRTADVVVLPSGRVVPGVAADYRGLVLDPHGIVDVQMVQNEIGVMDVYYVPAKEFREENLRVYIERMDRIFLGELEWRTHPVERIEPEPNGKVRCLISRVPRP